MRITSATFVTSAVRNVQYPPADRPEVAFAGRSNVGKSSLINRLVQRKRLAKTSSTPGRTQLINFFNINDAFYIVDLPGYGYAKVPAAVKRQWGPMIEAYLTGRETLRVVIMLMDIRREPKLEEHQMFAFLAAAGVPGKLVITKADKVSRNQRVGRIADIVRSLPLTADDVAVASARTGEGVDDIWSLIVPLVTGGASDR
ncbi:MAG: ribosome biogenesis GTP-binding protein YihA/YsxC [Desulfobacterales bacterium]|jgi:GTP-binding protein